MPLKKFSYKNPSQEQLITIKELVKRCTELGRTKNNADRLLLFEMHNAVFDEKLQPSLCAPCVIRVYERLLWLLREINPST